MLNEAADMGLVRIECLDSDARGIGIASSGFRDDEGRCNEIEPVWGHRATILG